jgi:serine/threonine-protein kinase HipA
MAARPANAHPDVLGRSFAGEARPGLNGCTSRASLQGRRQALGVVPELKYQNEGGPGLAQCFALLRSVTRPSAAGLRLLDGVSFNA